MRQRVDRPVDAFHLRLHADREQGKFIGETERTAQPFARAVGAQMRAPPRRVDIRRQQSKSLGGRAPGAPVFVEQNLR